MSRKSGLLTLAAALALASCQSLPGDRASETVARPIAAKNAEMAAFMDYAKNQNTTGLLVIQDGKRIVEANWPAPAAPLFKLFAYERTANGELLEDVASQQKSFIAVLVAVAADKALIDKERSVTDYLGEGWSKASPDQEARIRVADVLAMNSGLDEKFGYVAPPGSQFFYNTAVYAILKDVLTAASGLSLEQLTRQWLTEPLAMNDTAWRKRPAALGDVGNATGLVTSPSDTARFGEMILAGGVTPEGRRIVSQAALSHMFERSATNPAYGELWWLNGSDFVVRAGEQRRPGALIPSAPDDLVAALGFLDRRLYIVPSRNLIVVRTGAAADDADFDENLWRRLMPIIG